MESVADSWHRNARLSHRPLARVFRNRGGSERVPEPDAPNAGKRNGVYRDSRGDKAMGRRGIERNSCRDRGGFFGGAFWPRGVFGGGRWEGEGPGPPNRPPP